MSMSAHGISRLYCVCRCSSGLVSEVNPPIHILAGENVCIQAIRPMQFGAALASRQSERIASGVVSTGLNTTFTGIADASEKRCSNLLGMRGDFFQRFRPVQVLAASDKPHVILFQINHKPSFLQKREKPAIGPNRRSARGDRKANETREIAAEKTRLNESVNAQVARRARLAVCRESSNVCVIGAANSAAQGGAHMSFEAELKAGKCREKRP